MYKKKYYITTAIIYASGKPHIGNIYEIVLADSIARFKRLQGYDVFFQTGTDEHGLKIENKAKRNNINCEQFVNKISYEIKKIFKIMNISYNKFIRTTEKNHKKQVQKIFKKLYNNGDIYKDYYNGMYCTQCESFYSELQLKNNRCPDCGSNVNITKEEAYFFKTSKYSKHLIEYINKHPKFIQPIFRKKEIMNNFLCNKFQDLCISRTSFNWGIHVDFDKKHIIYVWFDALINYITGIGYNYDKNKFNKYWPANLHLVGKDIMRFHVIYWPILLMSLNLQLPKQIFGHPWFLCKNNKMSKSKSNTIYIDKLINIIGVDAIRYFMLHEISFDNDSPITLQLIIEHLNSDLVNILGNLVNRTVSMINKYCNGIVKDNNKNELIDKKLKTIAINVKNNVSNKIKKLYISKAISEIFVLFKYCNKYIDITQPWTLIKKNDKKRLSKILYNLIECICIGSSLLYPFLPETSNKIMYQLNTKRRDYKNLGHFGLYKSGTKIIDKPKILFKRISFKEIKKKL